MSVQRTLQLAKIILPHLRHLKKIWDLMRSGRGFEKLRVPPGKFWLRPFSRPFTTLSCLKPFRGFSLNKLRQFQETKLNSLPSD